MKIHLVKATSENAKLIWEMQQEAFKDLLQKYQDYETNPGNETLGNVMSKINQNNTSYYLIYQEEVPVGAIRVIQLPNGEKRISPLFVLSQYRNQGIAQAAIKVVEQLHGEKHWALETILEEKGNCYLYEKMGYLSTGKTEKVNDNLTLVLYYK